MSAAATSINLSFVLCILILAIPAGIAVLAVVLWLVFRPKPAPARFDPAAASFTEHLKNLRTGHGFSQEDVAERLGVSRQAVSKWETGASEPSTANLRALAELYQVSLDELIGRQDGM